MGTVHQLKLPFAAHAKKCDCEHCVAERAAAKAKRDEAIHRVEEATPDEWKDHALSVVHELCLAQTEFTADDVWNNVSFKPANQKALGPVMRKARRLKYCEATNAVLNTTRASRNLGLIRVWHSLIHRG